MQPSTLPAESLFKGFIRAYYGGTHTADVQLAASPRETIDGVRVATHICAADCVVDRECTVLFFGAANCQDAIVISVQGALPSSGPPVTDHGALTGLADDDHAQYALLAGRAAGQTVIGDTASGGHLTLQSTAHTTRGYVRAQDDVQLLSGYLRDSAGTARIQLAAASPHVAITGDADVSGHLAVGSLASVTAYYAATINEQSTSHPCAGLYNYMIGIRASGAQFTYGLSGGAIGQGTPSTSYVYGLYFFAQHNQPNPCAELGGILVQLQCGASGSGAISAARAIRIPAAYWGNAKPATSWGIDIEEQGGAGVTTAYGVRILNQTATNVYLLEATSAVPAAPYLRLVGGAAPAANCTHLWLAEGVTPTLRNVQWKLYSALVAGDRVCVLV